MPEIQGEYKIHHSRKAVDTESEHRRRKKEFIAKLAHSGRFPDITIADHEQLNGDRWQIVPHAGLDRERTHFLDHLRREKRRVHSTTPIIMSYDTLRQ